MNIEVDACATKNQIGFGDFIWKKLTRFKGSIKDQQQQQQQQQHKSKDIATETRNTSGKFIKSFFQRYISKPTNRFIQN